MASKNEIRQHKHRRVRKKIAGSAERPRLVVTRSLKHISAQLINDDLGVTLASASTLNKGVEIQGSGNQSAARKIGALLAERAKAAGIEKVVFDRAGNLYHGRIKALADGAREGGLQF